MTYSLRFRVPLPIAAYDGLHAVIKDTPGTQDGLLVHLGWETPDGFEIIEVWESRAAYDAFVDEVWPRIVERLGQGPMPAAQGVEFDLRGFVVSATDSVYV